MSFDWDDYLRLAERLAEDASKTGEEEAHLRSAVSRAYYAAFHKAEAHLRNVENDAKLIQRFRGNNKIIDEETGGNIHKYVRKQFQRDMNVVRLQIASNLQNLLDDRNIADYDDVPVYQRKMKKKAGEVIAAAREVIEALAALTGP